MERSVLIGLYAGMYIASFVPDIRGTAADIMGCFESYYLSNGSCYPCLDQCATCNSADSCTKCKQGFYGQSCQTDCQQCPGECHQIFGHCTLGCPDGQFPEPNSPACLYCKQNCTLCSSSTHCVKCEDGLFGKTCSESCPESCMDRKCHHTGECFNCKTGYYKDDVGKCVLCPDGCLSCVNGFYCSECKDGNLGPYNGVCLETCPTEAIVTYSTSRELSRCVLENCTENRCLKKGYCLNGTSSTGISELLNTDVCDAIMYQECTMKCDRCGDVNEGETVCNEGFNCTDSCQVKPVTANAKPMKLCLANDGLEAIVASTGSATYSCATALVAINDLSPVTVRLILGLAILVVLAVLIIITMKCQKTMKAAQKPSDSSNKLLHEEDDRAAKSADRHRPSSAHSPEDGTLMVPKDSEFNLVTELRRCLTGESGYVSSEADQKNESINDVSPVMDVKEQFSDENKDKSPIENDTKLSCKGPDPGTSTNNSCVLDDSTKTVLDQNLLGNQKDEDIGNDLSDDKISSRLTDVSSQMKDHRKAPSDTGTSVSDKKKTEGMDTDNSGYIPTTISDRSPRRSYKSSPSYTGTSVSERYRPQSKSTDIASSTPKTNYDRSPTHGYSSSPSHYSDTSVKDRYKPINSSYVPKTSYDRSPTHEYSKSPSVTGSSTSDRYKPYGTTTDLSPTNSKYSHDRKATDDYPKSYSAGSGSDGRYLKADYKRSLSSPSTTLNNPARRTASDIPNSYPRRSYDESRDSYSRPTSSTPNYRTKSFDSRSNPSRRATSYDNPRQSTPYNRPSFRY